jgi:hypothetical protein
MEDEKHDIQTENQPVKKRGRLKRLIKTLLIIAVILSVLQYVFYYYALPIMKDGLCNIVNKSSNGLYSMNFDGFRINFLSKSFEIDNFSLSADTAVYLERINEKDYNKGIYNISAKKIAVKNISFFALLRDRLRINIIELENPKVSLVAKPKKSEGKKYDAVHNDLFPAIEPFLNALIVNSIKINDGYFDLNTKVGNEKRNIEVSKIDITLKKFYLDREKHQKRNTMFFSKTIELNSENYDIILGDSIHTLKTSKLYINTEDSIIYAENAKLAADGVKANTNISNNKFNVGLKTLKITGLDINKAYFEKVVNLKNVIIAEPSIEFLQAGKMNKKTKKFEKFSSNFYPLIQGTLKSVAVDTLKIEDAKLRITKAATPQKPTYTAENINIFLEKFLLDSLAYKNKGKILYSENIGIKIADYQMFLPDNRHKFSAKNILASTKDKALSADKIIIRPTYKTADSTQKEINIRVPKLEISDLDIIKSYNTGDYQAATVKIILPEIETKSFIDTAKNNAAPKHNLVSALSDEFFKSLKIRNVIISKGSVDVTSKTAIKEDSLRLFGKMTLNLSNFTINKKTLSQGTMPFLTTNVNLQLQDLVMKTPKNFHTLRCSEFSVNTKKDKVLIEKFSYNYDRDSSIIETMKRLGKSSMIDISISKAEFTKIRLLDVFFKQEVSLEKLLVSNPKISISIYPQLKKAVERDSVKTERDSLQDSVYRQYTEFDKILADVFPKAVKLIKVDTLLTDSSILTFNFRDTMGRELVSTTSDFMFVTEGFFYSPDSISTDKKIMFAKDYELNINNFEFLLPDRVHLLRTGNIDFSTKKNQIKIKTLLLSERPSRKFSPKNIINFYVPELYIKDIDFEKFAETGIMPAGLLKFDDAVMSLSKNVDFVPDTTNNRTKKQGKNNPVKGAAFDSVSTYNSAFRFYRGDVLDMFRDEVLKTEFDLSVKNFSIDSANFSKSGYIMDFEKPFVDIGSFQFVLKDSSRITVDKALEKDGKLRADGFFWGSPDNPRHTRVTCPEIILTDAKYTDLIFQKKITGHFMDMKSPGVEIFPGNKKTGLDDVLYKMFNTVAFEIDTVTSDNFRMDINLRDNRPKVVLKNMDLNISDFNSQKYKDRDIPGRLVLAGIDDHTFYMKDSVFKLNFPRAVLNPNTHEVRIKNMDFRPYTNRYDFCKAFDISRSATFITCETAVAKNFDWKTAIEKKTLNMDSLYLDKVSFLSYGDNSKPNGTEVQPTLLQWLDRIPFYLNVRTAKISDSYLGIEQLNAAAAVPGIMTINGISAKISNLSNDPSQIKSDDTLVFSAKGRLMNRYAVAGSFKYPRNSAKEDFDCRIKVDSVFLPDLNPFLENALFAKINGGTLYSANIMFHSDNNSSKGISSFEYKDLKVALNKADSVQEKKRKLLSLLANMFVKKKNTKKIGYIYAEPDSTRGFTSYWVKSILSGIKATMGFESKEQKDERKIAERVKDVMSRGKQRKKLKEDGNG